MAPTVNIMPHAKHFGFNNCAATFLRAKIGPWQEHLPNSDQLIIRLVTSATNLILKKCHWDLHVNTRAVTRLAVSVHGTTVPNSLQRVNAFFNHIARRGAINRNHQSDTARAMLFLMGIKPILGHPIALCLFSSDPSFIINCHGISPSEIPKYASVSASVIRL